MGIPSKAEKGKKDVMAAVVYIGKEFLKLAVQNVRDAKSYILVMMYEWAWYEGQRSGTIQDLNRELCIASKRGVKVRVILHNESKGRHLGKINRKTAGRLQRNGCQVLLQPMQRALHAKVWIFDGKVAMVGSHNISERAVNRNIEVGCEIRDTVNIAKLLDLFEEIWERGITPHQGEESASASNVACRT